jgi:hypothetical protein
VDGAVGSRYGGAGLIFIFSTFLWPYREKFDISSADARR